MVEPGAPAPLHGHAQAELHDAHEHAARQQRQVEQRQRSVIGPRKTSRIWTSRSPEKLS
jgi:hypothetical protein